MLGTDFFFCRRDKEKTAINPEYYSIFSVDLFFIPLIFLGNQAEYNVFLLTVPMLNLPSGFRWQDLIDCIIFPQGPWYPVLIYTLYLYFASFLHFRCWNLYFFLVYVH